MKYIFFIVRNVIASKWAYKFNLFLEVAESILALFVQILIWISLFNSVDNSPVLGYSLSDLLTYVVISKLAGMIISTKFAVNLADEIKNGDVTMNFVRPCSPRLIFIVRSLGNSIMNLLTVGIPTLLIGFFLPYIKTPPSIVQFLFFLCSIVLGIVICVCFELIAGILAFWKVPGDFMEWYFSVCFVLLSGAIVPLWFFPKWLLIIAKCLPFQAAFFTPVQTYLGQLPLTETINALLIQLFWVLLLFVFQEFLWRNGIKRLTISGG